jgi:Sec-independent protein translocase protein TatA
MMKGMVLSSLLLIVVLCIVAVPTTIAFVPLSTKYSSYKYQQQHNNFQHNNNVQNLLQQPKIVISQFQNQQHSITTKLYGGLFGLGPLEIGIILIGVGVVIGPAGIASVAKSAATRTSELASEMKNIPQEFQQGIELGEIEARSKKAKRIIITKQQQQSTDTTTTNNNNE